MQNRRNKGRKEPEWAGKRLGLLLCFDARCRWWDNGREWVRVPLPHVWNLISQPPHPTVERKTDEPKSARFHPKDAFGRAKHRSAEQRGLAISKRANCRAGARAGNHRAEITRWIPSEIKGAYCRRRRHSLGRPHCVAHSGAPGSACNTRLLTWLTGNTFFWEPWPSIGSIHQGNCFLLVMAWSALWPSESSPRCSAE